MEVPEIYHCNGYEIFKADNGWLIGTDEGTVAGPYSTRSEAERAADQMLPERGQ